MKPLWMMRARAFATEKRAAIAALTKFKPAPRATLTLRNAAAAEDDSGADATLYIYEQIGHDWWSNEGCSAKDVVNLILDAKKAGAKSLAVRILSEGGDAFEGMGIHDALRRSGLQTTAYNDGLCASAATMVALGCQKVVAAPTSMWMMHRAWNYAAGNVDDMRSMADLLEKMDGMIANVYAQKSGESVADCLKMMSAASGGPDGTWMTAEECKDAGFVDEVASVESNEPDEDDDPSAAVIVRIAAQTRRRLDARDRLTARISKDSSPGQPGKPGQPGVSTK